MIFETKYNLFDKVVVINDNYPIICEISRIYISMYDKEHVLIIDIFYDVVFFDGTKHVTLRKQQYEVFENIDKCLDDLKNRFKELEKYVTAYYNQ